MIKTLAFDLDGTLVETKDIHYHALNDAIEWSVGGSFRIDYKDHLTNYDGLSTKRKLEKLGQKYPQLIKFFPTIEKNKQKITIDLLKKIESNPKWIDLFKRLFEKYQIAVVSNAIRSTIDVTLYQLGIRSYVHRIISNQDGVRNKPSPDMYLLACLLTECDPSEMLVVEDSKVGREAGLRAGCKVMSVKNPDWTEKELMEAIESTGTAPRRKWQDKKLNVVIPMAGRGSRFEQAGYTFPKPLIDVDGKPMIQRVVDNLGVDANFIFIVQQEHREKYNLDTFLNLIAPGCNIISIDKVTQGAACTVLLAQLAIDNENPLVIANSDQVVKFDPQDFYYSIEADRGCDGKIMTFKATHPKWSFVKVVDGYVAEVAEKKPISDDATVGVYYWKHGSDFVTAAHAMIQANDRTNGEFYVAPAFNYAINNGVRIKPYQVETMYGLGTPEDLEFFLKHRKVSDGDLF